MLHLRPSTITAWYDSAVQMRDTLREQLLSVTFDADEAAASSEDSRCAIYCEVTRMISPSHVPTL